MSSTMTNTSMTLLAYTRNKNFSSFQQIWVRKPLADIILRSIYVVPILLVGIIGNGAIIHSVCKFKSIRSKPTNLFVLNMAIADLAATIVCANAALISDIHQNYVLGSFMCRFEGFIKITCLLVSINSLVVLSYDRLISIVKPFWPRITVNKSWIAIVIIWIVSMIMASPLAYWRSLRERQWKDFLEVWCAEDLRYTKYYWLVITGFLIYLPMATMTIVFIVILAQMDRFDAKLRRSSTCALQGNSSMKITYRRKIVKMLIIYLLTSLVCWTPFQITVFYRHFNQREVLPPWFREVCFFSQLLASLSSAMNPIIFGFLSEPFRKVLSKSMMFKLFAKVINVKPSKGKNNDNNQNINNNQKNLAKMSKRQDMKEKWRHTHDPSQKLKQVEKSTWHRSSRLNKTASFNTLGLVLHNNDQLAQVINHSSRKSDRPPVQLVDTRMMTDCHEKQAIENSKASSFTNRDRERITFGTKMIKIHESNSSIKEFCGGNNQAIILGSLNRGLQIDDELDEIRNDQNDRNTSINASHSIMSIGFTSIGLSRENLNINNNDIGSGS